jgi:hypothetical protein
MLVERRAGSMQWRIRDWARAQKQGGVVLADINSLKQRIQKGESVICCVNATYIPNAQTNMWFF